MVITDHPPFCFFPKAGCLSHSNDENMPLDERVIAGDKYVSLGGNGSIHVKYEVLKEQYKGQLKKEGI